MEVLLFQIIVAAIIIVVGASGKKERDGITIILIIFTLVAVFMTWLIIVQFITIAIAYQISSSLEENSNFQSNQQTYYLSQSRKSNGFSFKSCFLVIIIFIAIVYIFSIFSVEETKNTTATDVTKPNDTLKNTQSEEVYYKPVENSNDSEESGEVASDTFSTNQSSADYRYDDEHDDPQNERVYEQNER